MSYVPRRTSTPIALCVIFRVAVIFDLHCLSAVPRHHRAHLRGCPDRQSRASGRPHSTPSERHDPSCSEHAVRQSKKATLPGMGELRFPALVHGQELKFESGNRSQCSPLWLPDLAPVQVNRGRAAPIRGGPPGGARPERHSRVAVGRLGNGQFIPVQLRAPRGGRIYAGTAMGAPADPSDGLLVAPMRPRRITGS